jgi:hypothetical protein
MMRSPDIILMATIQVKQSIDQVVPLLELAAKEEPPYQPVYEAYKRIQEDLGKAATALKGMK